MNNGYANNYREPRSARGLIGLLGCVVGIGLVLLAFRMVTVLETTPTGSPQHAAPTHQRPVSIASRLNLALGHAVVTAPELGFVVTGENVTDDLKAKISGRLESQLLAMRQLFQEEGVKKPGLMGSIVLQLTVRPSGEVTQVKEIASRFLDSDFKKTLVAEASKWKFYEIVTEAVKITCALLFIREGMDITTVVMWEKALGSYEDKTPAAPKVKPANLPAKAAENASVKNATAPQSVPDKEPDKAVRVRAAEFEIRYPTAVRKEPNFAAASLSRLTTGTRVTAVGKRGDWLEVRFRENEPSGFIRREFVSPLESAQKR